MKISLSASGFNIPPVAELLNECDLIFTTQVINRDELWKLFGRDKVHFIPDACNDTLEFMKSKYPDAEFIGFSELFKLKTLYLEKESLNYVKYYSNQCDR